MSTINGVTPTEKQYAYGNKLREQLGAEKAEEIACLVFGSVVAYNGTVTADRSGVNKASYSRYIDRMKAALGIETAPRNSRNYGGRRTRSYAGGGYSFRCSHEDYPCCGCGQ